MTLWKIAWRNVEHKALASTLTAVSMALGVALVVTVLVIHGVIDKSFRRGAQGYDLIVGAKGSSLQLVLNTVYHLQQPVGNIPYDYYLEVAYGRYGADVELAIPMCMGGNYHGYRIVGTIPEMFSKLEYAFGKKYKFAEGENFQHNSPFEGVIGSTVAAKTGLAVGDTFRPVHGFDAEQGDEHDPFTVAGILAPTGTPNDRALFINMEGFYLVHEHDHDHDAHAHDASGDEETRMVTAVLVCTDPMRPLTASALPRKIGDEGVAQAVWPSEQIEVLLQGMVGNAQLVLLVLAVLVVLVAGIGMLVSMYNSMNDRRHDIAVMRALGARRRTVMTVILLESILLALSGGAGGLLLGHGLIGLLGPTISEQTGIAMHALQFQPAELILIPGLILLATLVGYLPAVIAYRTDVVQSLSSSP